MANSLLHVLSVDQDASHFLPVLGAMKQNPTALRLTRDTRGPQSDRSKLGNRSGRSVIKIKTTTYSAEEPRGLPNLCEGALWSVLTTAVFPAA